MGCSFPCSYKQNVHRPATPDKWWTVSGYAFQRDMCLGETDKENNNNKTTATHSFWSSSQFNRSANKQIFPRFLRLRDIHHHYHTAVLTVLAHIFTKLNPILCSYAILSHSIIPQKTAMTILQDFLQPFLSRFPIQSRNNTFVVRRTKVEMESIRIHRASATVAAGTIFYFI